ncbi:ABC transporter ATP-binding protein [Paenibacillus sp. 481]|uniref:ABC transporter ATP-binding protein n=1 Tax=Paenibacillus sp. 481 TaxID=2835869 RepID=UPI001E5A9133|nr:ABC transporter ATP-binding protein [Paenibacillus sp. 481]UHA74543.1 ABC transporter ATP-binding protein [Paenibacillus sp. 481]
MSELLQVQHLTGGYSIGRPVLHDVTFDVRPGEMVGLIGLNGAGKSTTMKHILGLMEPHKGKVQLGGSTVAEATEAYRASLAYVPESPLLYDALTVREHLVWTATAYGVPRDVFEQRVEQLAAIFHMEQHLDKAAQHLSKGMKQKTMLMGAFAVRPPLYIIDEPFLGLDPLGIRSLLRYMSSVKEDGAALLVSSHILSTIEHYCDRFVLLHQGRVISSGTVEEMQAQFTAQRGVPAEARIEELFYAWVGTDEHAEGALGGGVKWES